MARPPDGKDSWGIPIDGSVVVDNKGKSDTSFTYPGAQLLFENEVTGNGYAVMWDSPGTANYIFEQLKAKQLKNAAFFSVVSSYTVLIFQKDSIIGNAEYSIARDSNGEFSLVQGDGKVNKGSPPEAVLAPISIFTKKLKISVPQRISLTKKKG